ncbi:MAG: 5-oxoprolinase subunit PxpA [Gammaproteobacteria bacterium]
MHIDLNADLGEGGAFDHELLALVSSANISCGAHAGDTDTINNAIRLAVTHNVRIGAHPSYPDRANFGRRPMQLSFSSLRQHVLSQLESLRELVGKQHGELSHIKPHGALYNQLAIDEALAQNFTDIVKEFDSALPVVGLAGGVFLRISKEAGLQTYSEAFADRRYQHNGELVPRSDSQALIHDVDIAVAQSLAIIRKGQVKAITGEAIPIIADTLCIHGDSVIALQFAKKLRHRLAQEGVRITAFTTDH